MKTEQELATLKQAVADIQAQLAQQGHTEELRALWFNAQTMLFNAQEEDRLELEESLKDADEKFI